VLTLTTVATHPFVALDPKNAMDSSRYGELMELFDAAADLAPAEQQAFLIGVGERDTALQQRLALMLAADAAGGDGHSFAAPLENFAAAVVASNTQDRPALPSSGSVIDPFAPGARVAQYELIRKLGEGGMGSVYLARDTKLGRRVAIKFLRQTDPTTAERFRAEASNTARCRHENIVVIHDVSEFQGTPFMVLEYLAGDTLQALRNRGPITARRAVRLAVPMVRALAYAHERQIVHRDLKPENIIVTRTGAVKVLDFGIAKCLFEPSGDEPQATVRTSLEVALAQPELTHHDAIVGTMPYMSPEQWDGVRVDARSDLWAIGIILYELLVGKHPLSPLRGPKLIVTAIRAQPMPSARDANVEIPRELADIIDRCLQKDPAKRFRSAADLLQALEALLPERHGGLDADESPYAGLSAFQEGDAGRFFGRARDIASLLSRLQSEPLVGVVGPSGVGKSSFVRAGVIPALKASGDDWESLVIRPGRQPLEALARVAATALSDHSAGVPWRLEDFERQDETIRCISEEPGYLGRILRSRATDRKRKICLFVDQFEELYTLTADLGQRLAFTRALLAVADDADAPLRVVLSIRSDFLDRVAEDRAFMAEVDKSLYFLVQPDREGLRDAITCPAALVSYQFESPRIVEQMLDQLASAAGALPLLQFAATRLWDFRDTGRRLLTERAYEQLGGVEGALTGHANAVLASLTPQEQSIAQALFLQLVTKDRTRAIVSVAELRELWHEPQTVQHLVDKLVQARLLIINTDKRQQLSLVEIVHESLIHRWPMLNHWLDQNQEDASFLEQLKQAAKQWEERGKPRDLLWRGQTAREAAAFRSRYRGLLPLTQNQFLTEISTQHQRTLRLRRGAVVAALVSLSMFATAATIAFAYVRSTKETIEQQYRALQAEIAEKQRAQAKATTFAQKAEVATSEVEASRVQLREKNRELEQANVILNGALGKAQAAEESARQAETRAWAEANQAQQARKVAEGANARLDRVLADKQAKLEEAERRVRELESKLGRIHDDL